MTLSRRFASTLGTLPLAALGLLPGCFDFDALRTRENAPDGSTTETMTDGSNPVSMADASNLAKLPDGSQSTSDLSDSPDLASGGDLGSVLVCPSEYADCDHQAINGCEAKLDSDPRNCGACGAACSTVNVTPACGGGQCNGGCFQGYADCNNDKRTDGCEVNTLGDPNNCNGCGHGCSANNMATRTCGDGMCNGQCDPGYADCDNNKMNNGCEISLLTDPKNCGQCKVDCTHGVAMACVNGSCGCAVANDCNPIAADTCSAGVCQCGGSAACAVNQQCVYGNCLLVHGQACYKSKECASGACSNGQCQ